MAGGNAVVLWAAVTMAIVLTACGEKLSPEASALADVIRGAQTAELNTDVVPPEYHGPGSAASAMQPVLDRVRTELGKYYIGSLLTRKVNEHQDGIRGMAQAGAGG